MNMPAFYAETRNLSGNWSPCRLAEIPTVQRGRIKRNSGPSPVIRQLGTEDGKPVYARRIQHSHMPLTLDQLREVYSPDGIADCAQGKVRVDGGDPVEMGDYMERMSEGWAWL